MSELEGAARLTLATRFDPTSIEQLAEGRIMPRFGNQITTSVVFLYPSADHARRHDRIGGTGLIVGKLMGNTGLYAPYLVTCRHVAMGGSPVVRINRRDGGQPDILDLLDVDYVPHPSGVDLAIHPLSDHIRVDDHAFTFSNVESFVTKERVARHDIGAGDDVFMVGRYLHLQGARDNAPAIRVGNFSHDLDRVSIRGVLSEQECFAVEMRSRTGFSGSPVYVWGTKYTALARQTANPADDNFIYLLGINAGYITDPNADPGEENTWLNAVIPAWRIVELFEAPAIRDVHERRTQRTANAIALLRSLTTQAEPTMDHPPTSEAT